jgi:murein DD-endopeptidase MepM/ murein hydrolase activator NlpD
VSVTVQTSEVSPAVQQSAQSPVRGRHREETLHRHRAPGHPIGDRSRYAMVTAALIVGVGVAGVSAATAGAHPASLYRAAMAAQTPVSAEQSTETSPTPTALPSFIPNPAPTGTPESTPDAPLGFARVQQKQRPVVVVEATWVHPLPEAAVTSCFGQRWGRLHAGVDLAAANGTRIRAAGAGTVVLAGAEAGYGNAVLVDHGNGYLTHYGHLSAITVTVGQHVKTGEQIGNEGSTGHSTGPHLHFEVHRGAYKNPIEPTAWMHAHGVDIPGCVPLNNRTG